MDDIDETNALNIASSILFNIYKNNFEAQEEILISMNEARNGDSKRLKLYLKELSDCCNKIINLI